MLGDDGCPAPAGSMLREGRSMVTALAGDLLRIPDTEVTVLRDARLPPLSLPECSQTLIHDAREERTAIARLAGTADRTILIAPESDGALAARCQWVEAAGGRLASPDLRFVSYASDKNVTAELLEGQGLPVPSWTLIRRGDPLPADFGYPAVLKPIDGAGSAGIQWVANRSSHDMTADLPSVSRLESFCVGLPASVAVLCGPARLVPLPACTQRLSDDGKFRYLGGETLLDTTLSKRARSLAIAAIESLPATLGYVGVDLILGTAADGSEDVVIEVNPRLTMSYIGLSRLLQNNLASAMLQVADGESVELSFARRCVRFDV